VCQAHQTLTLLLDLCVHAHGRLTVLDNTLSFKRLRGLRNGQKRIHMQRLLTPHWATIKTGLATSTNVMFSSPALALVLKLLLELLVITAVVLESTSRNCTLHLHAPAAQGLPEQLSVFRCSAHACLRPRERKR